MSVRLRPHHLLCMLTFVGKGYTPEFTRSYRRIATRLSAGEAILIVDGPDDICAPLLADPQAHCRRDSVIERDDRAAQAAAAILGHDVVAGTIIIPDAAMLDAMRNAFRSGTARDGCHGCEWHDLCTSVAENGFDGVLVDANEPHTSQAPVVRADET